MYCETGVSSFHSGGTRERVDSPRLLAEATGFMDSLNPYQNSTAERARSFLSEDGELTPWTTLKVKL